MLGFLLGVGWIQGDVDGAQTQAGDVQRDGVHILRDSCENSVTFLDCFVFFLSTFSGFHYFSYGDFVVLME